MNLKPMVDQIPNFRRLLSAADDVLVHQHPDGTEVEVFCDKHGYKRFWLAVVKNPEGYSNRFELVIEERR